MLGSARTDLSLGVTAFAKAWSRPPAQIGRFIADKAVIVSDLLTRTFNVGPLPRLLPPDVPRVSMHWAFLGPRNPPRAPTTKDFAEKGGSVEVSQSSWLSAPDCPEQRGDKVDLLSLHEGNQISDDGARLIRVVRGVGDDRGAVRPRQRQLMAQPSCARSVRRRRRPPPQSGALWGERAVEMQSGWRAPRGIALDHVVALVRKRMLPCSALSPAIAIAAMCWIPPSGS